MSTQMFKVGSAELENFLPAVLFKGGEGGLDSALTAVAKTLSADGRFEAKDMRRGLCRATATWDAKKIFRALGNIRRWALEGLGDQSIPPLLAHLESPDAPPRSEQTPSPSNKASRSVTARQARLVLSNAFLGNCNDVMAPYKDPMNAGGLDFRPMLQDPYGRVGHSKIECLLWYFDACGALEGTSDDERVIEFERIFFKPLESDEDVDALICAEEKENGVCARFVGDGVVLHNGTMESPTRPASAFVNFANANFGYGEFIPSCTQEEILTVCCPEFNVGLLFIGKMKNNEVVNVCGVRRYAQYSGYLDSFSCEGPTDIADPVIQTVLTMDACYRRHFSSGMLGRDLGKAYHSFRLHAQHLPPSETYPVVSTGKWGCGMFGGLPAHKMVQQALAAHLARVDLDFSCFGNYEGCDEVLAAMRASKPSAGRILKLLQLCHDRRTFVKDAVDFLGATIVSAGEPGLQQVPDKASDQLDDVV